MFALGLRSVRAAARSGPQSRRWMSVINLSDPEAVEKFNAGNKKSVLYFTAQWCGPCKQIKPLYEDMAKNHPDVAFGKVDIDDNADSATDYLISAVPTFITFEGDKRVDQFSGADPNRLASLVKDLESR